VIAHRPGTIRQADRTVVLKGGEVAEQGTHDELLRRGGAHAELYRLQFGSQQPAAGAPAR
jgi:ATP-binding cassette subfamily B protein